MSSFGAPAIDFGMPLSVAATLEEKQWRASRVCLAHRRLVEYSCCYLQTLGRFLSARSGFGNYSD